MHIFRPATTRIKIYQIPKRVSFSTNFASPFSVMRDFSFKALHALDKRSPSKCKLSEFRLLARKLTKFLMTFYKPRVSFPSDFVLPSSHMTHNSSETLYTLDKKSTSKYNFSDFRVL